MNPKKYSKELTKEQQKFPDKCLYHLSKSHSTDDCHVKKECARLSTANVSSSGTANNASGQLRHLTEDIVEEEVIVADLLYFVHVSNHYLCLVNNSSSSSSPRHTMQFPVIADSGANYHMFKEREFFESLTPATGSVFLGDGKTSLKIQGIGRVRCYVGNNILTLDNVRFIPDLGESIYSLFVHIQEPGHSINSSFTEGLSINFPTFSLKAIVGRSDIYLDAIPLSTVGDNMTPVIPSTTMPTSLHTCHNITDVSTHTPTLLNEHGAQENLLSDLRRYYFTTKTKRQLGLDISVGFRQSSNYQKLFQLHTPPRKAKDSDITTSNLDDILLSLVSDVVDTPLCSNKSSNGHASHVIANTSDNVESSVDQRDPLPSHVPIIRSVDKPSSSISKTIKVNEDYLRACVGFRQVVTLKKHLHTLYQPTFKLDNTPADAVLDIGCFASLRKKDRNTEPVPRPNKFGDVVHIDIVFGPEISIGNVHYGLLCVDSHSRMTYIYPLQNLTSDIPKQPQFFFAHIGIVPKRIISDFDLKLIGGKAHDYLNSLRVHVNAVPSYRQDKNGLAERHWQTLVCMARNWLASLELPASFWFYAVRCAAEVCNYFPLQLEDGLTTTPFELVHKTKPDLRVLFKPFALAAVCRERLGDDTLPKFESQSIPMITLGRCPNSNGLQFYNPVNGTIVSSIDYSFQHHVSSGSRFGYKYQPGTFVYRLDESNTMFSFGYSHWSTHLFPAKYIYC
jgi:hypothetical protein